MLFNETRLKGAFLVDLQIEEDERGFFSRSWCQNEFIEHGLNPSLVQCNVSFNLRKGTLRGMHYHVEPFPEAKLVRCTMGMIYDVIIDLRKDSNTFLNWMGIELSASNKKMLYIPEGFAHGFQCLEDNCELIYHHSEFYKPGAESGIRYNDPLINIKWPLPVTVISARDEQHPYLNENFKGI